MRSAALLVCFMLGSIGMQAEPVLRWAADPNSNAPYTFFAPGNLLTGFECEIVNAIARRLGRRAEFVQNDWSGLMTGLHLGLFDCVICGVENMPVKAAAV